MEPPVQWITSPRRVPHPLPRSIDHPRAPLTRANESESHPFLLPPLPPPNLPRICAVFQSGRFSVDFTDFVEGFPATNPTIHNKLQDP